MSEQPIAEKTEQQVPEIMPVNNFSGGEENSVSAGDKEPVIPGPIRELLAAPPLLQCEGENQFNAIFDSYCAYARPQNIIEWELVWNLTVNKHETIRYRFMAMAVTSNQQQAALKSLYIQSRSVPKHLEETLRLDAADQAQKCCEDEVYREQFYQRLEDMGYVPDGQAFLLSLPALATIERLLNAAEKRHAASLKELERRLAQRRSAETRTKNHDLMG